MEEVLLYSALYIAIAAYLFIGVIIWKEYPYSPVKKFDITGWKWLGFHYKFEYEVLDRPIISDRYCEYPVQNRYRYLYWFNWKIKKS